jgi:hypothetical protein
MKLSSGDLMLNGYLDRNAITLARLNGFQKDLGLTSSQYSTAISILFVGYILGQVS